MKMKKEHQPGQLRQLFGGKRSQIFLPLFNLRNAFFTFFSFLALILQDIEVYLIRKSRKERKLAKVS
jgi:hypothetical protein